MSETRLIYAAMAKVMKDVGFGGKTRQNPQQGYKFRGIDDVVAACQEVLSANGVCCIPFVVEREREMVPTKSGGTMASVRLLVDHHFFATDGSSVTARTLGEAMDSGDKASNKAMSAALKYALVEALMIPTYEADRDTEEHSPEIAAPKAKPAAKGPTNKPTAVAMPLSASGRVPTFVAPTAASEAKANDEVTKEVGLIKGLAQTAKSVADIEALRPRYVALKGALYPPEWDALGESLKARKTELSQ